MSASLRPPEAWMRIDCSLPVALSLAETCTMPLASISKVTSICGTRRRRRNAEKIELSQHLVVGRHFAFALEHADGHGILAVFGGRERLALLGRDRRVAIN